VTPRNEKHTNRFVDLERKMGRRDDEGGIGDLGTSNLTLLSRREKLP
jgi:hypothetical protein